MTNECEHGSLIRSCDICDLKADRKKCRAEYEELGVEYAKSLSNYKDLKEAYKKVIERLRMWQHDGPIAMEQEEIAKDLHEKSEKLNEKLKLNLVNRGSDLLAMQRVARKFEDENGRLKERIAMLVESTKDVIKEAQEVCGHPYCTTPEMNRLIQRLRESGKQYEKTSKTIATDVDQWLENVKRQAQLKILERSYCKFLDSVEADFVNWMTWEISELKKQNPKV